MSGTISLIVDGKQVATVRYPNAEVRKAIIDSWQVLIKGKYEVRIRPDEVDHRWELNYPLQENSLVQE